MRSSIANLMTVGAKRWETGLGHRLIVVSGGIFYLQEFGYSLTFFFVLLLCLLARHVVKLALSFTTVFLIIVVKFLRLKCHKLAQVSALRFLFGSICNNGSLTVRSLCNF